MNRTVVQYLTEQESLEEFEKETKLKLPSDFKKYAKSKKLKLLLNKEINISKFKITDKITNISKFTKYKYKNKFMKEPKEFWDPLDWEGLPKGAILFATCSGGNAIGFFKKKVYYFDHDPLRWTKIANNFSSFLKILK